MIIGSSHEMRREETKLLSIKLPARLLLPDWARITQESGNEKGKQGVPKFDPVWDKRCLTG